MVCLTIGGLFYSWFDKTKLEKRHEICSEEGCGGEARAAMFVEVPGM